MAFTDLSAKSTVWIDLLVRRLKMAVAAQDKKFTKDEIILTARRLCDDYIEDRLIRSGLQLKERKLCTPVIEEEQNEEDQKQTSGERVRPKRLSLTSMRKVSEIANKNRFGQDYPVIKSKRLTSGRDKCHQENISRVLIAVGEILETRHAPVYNDVFSQLNLSVLTELTLKIAFNGVAKHIFADGISWAKIVSLFAFTGALAVECVANGANTYVGRLKSWTVQFTADNLSDWIILHDGWGGLVENFAQDKKSVIPVLLLTLLTICMLMLAYGISSLFGTGQKK